MITADAITNHLGKRATIVDSVSGEKFWTKVEEDKNVNWQLKGSGTIDKLFENKRLDLILRRILSDEKGVDGATVVKHYTCKELLGTVRVIIPGVAEWIEKKGLMKRKLIRWDR